MSLNSPTTEPAPPQMQPSSRPSPSLLELAAVFFRLGTVAFGGPAAHIAMMDDEIVQRRQWMSRETLLDLIGVTNLLPGPNSTELAIHIGYEKAKWRGLFVAGASFILPAMTLVWILAALYAPYQSVPQVTWLLYGIKPVIVAVVLRALWKLGKKAAKDTPTTIAGLIAIALYFTPLSEVLLLLLAGLSVMLIKNWRSRPPTMGAFLLPFSGTALPLSQVSTAATAATSLAWTSVFFFFLKVGCVLYGSGYVLLAFLQRDLVDNHGWLTSQQLIDAIAIGQITPGPVFTTATFVGYLLAGNAGALAGTIGIFLPAFLLVGLVNPWVPKIRKSRWASSFLDGVNAGALGLMAGVTFTLSRAAIVDWLTVVLAVVSAITLFRFKINPAWLVLAGGAVGLLLRFSSVL